MDGRLRFARAALQNGVTLHYAERADNTGIPVLFLHGWPDSWFSFSRVLDLLLPSVRAIVPDQRGFGESDRPTEGFTVSQFAEDAIQLLDTLAIERAVVVGHSFGTFVARRMAISHPARVRALVLIDSGTFGGTPVVLEAAAALENLPDAVPVTFAREFQSGTVHAPLPAEFFDGIVAESMKLPGRLWRPTIDAIITYDDRAQLSQISVPTLLLWGDHDALFSRAHQDQLAAAIPNARLKIYPDTGHCPNWERPELVAADVHAFLNELR